MSSDVVYTKNRFGGFLFFRDTNDKFRNKNRIGAACPFFVRQNAKSKP